MTSSMNRWCSVGCASFVVVAAVAVVAPMAAPAPAGRMSASQASDGGPLKGSRQILVVVTDGWESVNGTMQRFERTRDSRPWTAAGPAVPVVVGRTGLAWGRGLHPPFAGPVKREGDGKAPAGVFRLSTAFGQSKEEPAGWRMPYRFLADNVECVDDVRSFSYNTLTTRNAKSDWSSSEKMWQEPLYKWGVVVGHNTPRPQQAGGSCIFLHIWNGPDRGTAGCTAMEESALAATIAWLVPGRQPLLVQMPRAEYERLKGAWRLP